MRLTGLFLFQFLYLVAVTHATLEDEIAKSMALVPGCQGIPEATLAESATLLQSFFLPPLCGKYFSCIAEAVGAAMEVSRVE